MTPLQIAAARQVIGLIGRTRGAVPFFYCAAGPDGLPALLLDASELDEGAVLALMASAQRKRFARGTLRRDTTGQLVFVAEGRGVRQLVADLSEGLEAALPGLRSARVTTPDA